MCSMYNKRKLIMSTPLSPNLSENPTRQDIDTYIKSANTDELKDKLSELKSKPGYYAHPGNDYFEEQINKKITGSNGGRRRSSKSSKKQSARRRRSSKARKARRSRKARKARTTRRR